MVFAIGELKLTFEQLYSITPFEYELRSIGYNRARERDNLVLREFATMFLNANSEKKTTKHSTQVFPFGIDSVGSKVEEEWNTEKDAEHIKNVTRHLPKQ